MGWPRSGLRATVIVAALLSLCAASQGCMEGSGRARSIHIMVENDDLRVSLVADEWGQQEHPGLAGLVVVENRSDHPVTVFESGDRLPTLLHVPPDGADLLFGFSEISTFAFWYACESFQAKVLGEGESYRYAFVIGNPLREFSNYANPAYGDPKSPWHGRGNEPKLWRKWQVRVGYLPFDFSRQFGPDVRPSANLLVQWQGAKRELIVFQRQGIVAGQLQPH
jgi:hypothetical protein